MLLAKYTFFPKDLEEQTKYELKDQVEGLMIDLQKNGQLWGQNAKGWVHGNLEVYVQVPKETALESQYHSSLITEALQKIETLCQASPIWQILEDPEVQINSIKDAEISQTIPENTKVGLLEPANSTEDMVAQHEECWETTSNFYLLTDMFDETSPLCCGTHGNAIPLYLLPLDTRIKERLYHFMQEYKTYDEVWLRSGPLEFQAYRQIASATSELAQEGLDLAQEIEKALHKPVYYFLKRYSGKRDWNKENRRLCPLCKRPWINPDFDKEDAGINHFFFLCQPCCLISEKAISNCRF